MERVNEKSTAYLAVTFRDKAGTAQAPVTASYRIDDVTTGQQVRDDTDIDAVLITEFNISKRALLRGRRHNHIARRFSPRRRNRIASQITSRKTSCA